MTRRVILASSSPRRRELLTLVGIAHEVEPADIDETALTGEAAGPHVERLAREKARVVLERHRDDREAPVVIAADTTVVIGDLILGKPRDAQDAQSTLRRLQGRTHTVYTAIAVATADSAASAIDTVAVTFRPLDEDQIAAYVRTGEPMDKAGSYGIQGYGATIVERITGDYFAVMGLGMVTLISLLEQIGARYVIGDGVQ